MNWLRKLAMLIGFPTRVAKTPDPLLERADKVIDSVDTLRVEVITRREARLRGLDLQAETRSGKHK